MDLATIGFRAETSGLVRARNDLDRLADQGERTEKRVSGAMGGIRKAFAAIAGTIGVGSLASKLIETERATGVLTSSLKVATGSAQGASDAFGAIQRLATQLPESVDSVSNAFIKLKNLGLDPSEAAIRSYSNTAAAMGKDLNQMIEAVADAATGEFERLKEFGIKAKQQGDQVSFTFQGVTTTVAKEADAITGYLRQIGDVNFASAATERMKTLDGVISNFGDTWDGLFRTVNSAGVGDFIAESVRAATGALQELNDLIASGQLGAYVDAIAIKFAGFSHDAITAFNEIASGYEWLRGMLAPSAGSVADFLLDAFKNLPENIRALIQLSAVEIAVLVDKAKVYGEQIAFYMNPANWFDQAPDISGSLGAIEQSRAESIALIMEERDAAIRSYDDQISKAEQLRKEYDANNAAALAAGDSLGKYRIKADEAADSVGKITTQTKQLASIADGLAVDELFGQFGDSGESPFDTMQTDIDASSQELDDLIASVDEFGGAWSRTGDTIAEALGSMSDGIDNYMARIEAITSKEAELAAMRAKTFDPEGLVKIARAEKKLVDERTKANISGYRQIAGAAASMFKENSKERRALTAVEQAMTAIELGLSLKRSLALATEAVLNQGKGDPYTAFARMAAMAAIVGAIGFAVGGGGGGGGGPSAEEIQQAQGTGSLLGSADKSESILNAMESYNDIGIDQLSELRGIRDAMSDLSSGISQLAISLVSGGRFSGMGIDNLGSFSNIDNNFEKLITGNEGPLVSSVTKAINSAIFGSTKKSLKDTGLLIGAQDLGDVLGGDLTAFYYNTIETTKKKLFGLSKSTSTKDQLSGADALLVDQFTSIFGFIGSAVTESMGSLGIDAAAAIEDFRINIGKISFKDLSGEEIEQELNAVFSQQADLIAAFVAPQIKQYQQMGEGLFETLTRVAKEQAVFNDALDGIGISLGDLSALMRIDVAQSVIQLMGGLEQFTDRTQEYFDAFFSEQEKIDMLAGSLADVFGSLNLALPQSRDEFRSLVESLDLTTVAGQEMFAVLMEVVPGLDQYIGSLEKAAEAQASAANKLAEAEAAAARAEQQAQARIDAQRNNLEIRLLQEQGKIDEALARQRELEIGNADESLRGLIEQIHAQQDANKALEEARKLAEEQARAAEESARAQIQAQEDALGEAERMADEQRRLIEGTQNAITSAIRALRGESEQLNDIDRQRAKNTLNAALAAAQAGKSIIGFAGLEEALTAVQNIDQSQFASAEAYQREVGQTLSILDRLGGYAGIAPKTPIPTTSPVIPMGTVTQAQTTQQLAVNVQSMEAQMLDLTKRIEKNTKTNADLMQRWEAIGMPATRA